MHRKPRKPNFIRQWREYRGLTLRQCADRMFDDHGNPLISYASLGRIERGLQPYSQPVLEALSEVLDATPAVLIGESPLVDEVSRLWERLSPDQKRQAIGASLGLMRAMLGEEPKE